MPTAQCLDQVIWELLFCQEYHKGRVRLVSAGFDGRMKIRDLDNDCFLADLENISYLYVIKAFDNYGQACLATGDRNGCIKLWMDRK